MPSWIERTETGYRVPVGGVKKLDQSVCPTCGGPRVSKITHGRHCTCSACAREDWTSPGIAPCGMHGSSCPRRYQPWGLAGSRDWVADSTYGRLNAAGGDDD
jgi:hypothetical protein